MSEQNPILELRNVSKSYGAVQALTDVSFKAYPGEVIGLVGDNGAGKSTLIKTISGVHAPSAGEVVVDGAVRNWKSPHDAMEAGIETLYQDSGLAPDLSIGANIFLGREIKMPGVLGAMGFMNQRQMDKRAAEELDKVGISVPAGRRTVSQLSGGQRQAVAIGRAVMWAKRVIILDEPTNHLGARQSQEVLNVIRAAKEHGLCVLFISHTLPHVLEVTDRIIVMRLGSVVKDAPTSDFTVESLLGTITGLNK